MTSKYCYIVKTWVWYNEGIVNNELIDLFDIEK